MTFDEVLKLPLGTRVRRPFYGKNSYLYLKYCSINHERSFCDEEGGPYEIDVSEMIQENWELYQEPRKYYSGLDALAMIYEGCTMALDDPAWLINFEHIRLVISLWDDRVLDARGEGYLVDAISRNYYQQNKWFKVN